MTTPTPSPTPSPAAGSPAKSMDAIMALCKRRGFIYQASEIYGGINGFWDYGPLGSQLKKNLRDAWWQDMILRPCWGRNGPNGQPVRCVPVETCIIQHPKVWEASGHVGGFNDPMQTCHSCKKLFRADHVAEALKASPWMKSFDELFAANGTVSGTALDSWLKSKGRKLAPGLGIHVPPVPPLQGLMMLKNGTPVEISLEEWRASLRSGILRADTTFSREDALDLIRGSWQTMAGTRPFFRYKGLCEMAKQPATNPCPECGGILTPPRQFNLMFDTKTGAVEDEAAKVYMRPETAQGIFVQFKNVADTTRVKMPFGIGNTGKSFRNEVTPRNFTFRSREFEQAELEFFCHPDESQAWYAFWRDFRMEWWKSIGLAGDNLILREHDKDELSHYSCGTSDVEYRFPFTAPGYGELEGIAHRGNYDLTQHQKVSGAKMEFNDTERGEILPNGGRRGEKYLPHCIEPAAGLDRGVLALLCEAYTKDESRASPEFLKLHPRLAPVKAAVFPLVAKDGMPEIAEKLHAELTSKFWRLGTIEMDEKQSIGKRYARMDEAGCPFCFTIDGESAATQTVTLRDRDSGAQTRMGIDKVAGFLAEKLGA